MWTREGLPRDGFHGLTSFLTSAEVQVACVQEVRAPEEAQLPLASPSSMMALCAQVAGTLASSC